jgi:hypothetical protein
MNNANKVLGMALIAKHVMQHSTIATHKPLDCYQQTQHCNQIKWANTAERPHVIKIQVFLVTSCRFVETVTDNAEQLDTSNPSTVTCPKLSSSWKLQAPSKCNCLPIYTAAYPTELKFHPHCCESFKPQTTCNTLPLKNNICIQRLLAAD